ncbi:glycosyltransferase [Demequina maris]|uniref:glycosyltransferase n=1 Tax=Demequina maris TaxID=1638982 RepID=UPI001E5D9E96|nr:glycosyltransferase [Demequina maris]
MALRSQSGAYGGPADTALAQSLLLGGSGPHDVRLISGVLAGDAPGEISGPVRVVQAPVRRLMPHLGNAGVFSWSVFSELRRYASRCDVMHVSFAREPVPIAAAILALAYRKRLVLQPHGMLTARTGPRQRLLDLLVKPIFRRATSVIALTEVEAAALRSWCGRTAPRTVVSGNPIPAWAGRLERRPSREALFLGRLEKRKRVTDFAEAARLSCDEGKGIGYAVVGPDQGDLAKLEPFLRDSADLAYEGAIGPTEVPQRLARTGVFVMTSLSEPWGNVLALALYYGIPVVITESAALAPAVSRYGAGVVVSDRSPEQVARGVASLLDSPTEYSAASDGARRLATELIGDESILANLNRAYAGKLGDSS